eukprot:16329-Heterococcus_DN1.PRE.4
MGDTYGFCGRLPYTCQKQKVAVDVYFSQRTRRHMPAGTVYSNSSGLSRIAPLCTGSSVVPRFLSGEAMYIHIVHHVLHAHYCSRVDVRTECAMGCTPYMHAALSWGKVQWFETNVFAELTLGQDHFQRVQPWPARWTR